MFSVGIYPARNMNKVDRYNTKFTEVPFVVKSLEDFIEVVTIDNISCKCTGGQKSSRNFESTDCLLMDIDNHNHDPNFDALWKECQKRFKPYAYYWVNSKSQNGYHCYFPLGEDYTDQKILLDLWLDLYAKISDIKDSTGTPVADSATKDRARLFFATTPVTYGYNEGRCWYAPPHPEVVSISGSIVDSTEDKEDYGLNDSFCDIVLGNASRGAIYTSIPNYALTMANLGYDGESAAKLFCDIYNIRTASAYKKSVITYINHIIDDTQSYNVKHIYVKEKYMYVIGILNLPQDKVVIYDRAKKSKGSSYIKDNSKVDLSVFTRNAEDSIKIPAYIPKEISF